MLRFMKTLGFLIVAHQGAAGVDKSPDAPDESGGRWGFTQQQS
jgi:hypothetical protein